MRIAQLAPVFEAVPPHRYGGTERVVDWLCRELTRNGHEVTLFAAGDSRTDAGLVPIVDRALDRDGGRLADPTALHLAGIELLRDRIGTFDVVHSHLDYHPFAPLRGTTVPIVTTLHGRLDMVGLPEVYRRFRAYPLVSISLSQRVPIPDANWIANVPHGLPLRERIVGPGDGGYLLFLGRISPEKRPDLAIDLARRAGVELRIAAKVDPLERRYFESVVAPALSSPGVQFLGEVDDAQKGELLRHARALLFPIDWPEPFGLVMIEALAAGTPVIARRSGSTPEVVADGVVGYLCDDEAELLAAIRRIDRIDRARCRAWAEQRFDSSRMAADYERVYAAVLEHSPAASA